MFESEEHHEENEAGPEDHSVGQETDVELTQEAADENVPVAEDEPAEADPLPSPEALVESGDVPDPEEDNASPGYTSPESDQNKEA
ncbi:MAG TPA: hypothetical protein VF272_01695 [Candidatus Saccharimonadia bacterium]